MNFLIGSLRINILKQLEKINVFSESRDFLRGLVFGRIPCTVPWCNIYPEALVNEPQSGNLIVKRLIEGVNTLLSKGKNFKGKFMPSKWRWYHRHGYWATRKKKLKFDTYRRHRYHEVRGPGPKPPSKWEDQSFFKPLRNSIKFW